MGSGKIQIVGCNSVLFVSQKLEKEVWVGSDCRMLWLLLCPSDIIGGIVDSGNFLIMSCNSVSLSYRH